jgi:hypothetical protein
MSFNAKGVRHKDARKAKDNGQCLTVVALLAPLI